MPKKSKSRSLKLPKRHFVEVPASIWKRLFAFGIDLLLVNLVLMAPFQKVLLEVAPELKTISYSTLQSMLVDNPKLTTIVTVISIFSGLLILLYFALLEYKIGQTFGKIILGLKVVSVTKEIRFWQCIVSNLLVIPVFPFFLFWIIDPFYMFFYKSNQRFLEKISRVKTIELVAYK